jgi:hypothetical protein
MMKTSKPDPSKTATATSNAINAKKARTPLMIMM